MNLSFVHTSDLHLAMKFDINKFSLKEREKRRQELWNALDDIVRFISEKKIKYFFITGDLVDGNYIKISELNQISQKFKYISQTNIIICSGKSDPYNINSLYEYTEWPTNVHFIKSTEQVERYDVPEDNLCIYSLSWASDDYNDKSSLIYDIVVDSSRINLLLLYCDVDKESNMLPIKYSLIKTKFDYCAFGGRHNFEVIGDGACYSGNAEPCSFDEENDHGVVVGSITKDQVKFGLEVISKRKFITREIRIEKGYSFNKILDMIKFSGDTFSNIKDYIRIILTGEINIDVSIEQLENEAKQFFYYIEFLKDFNYVNIQSQKHEFSDYDIVESYKSQFKKNSNNIEQEAFRLGLEVLSKEKGGKACI